MDRAVIFTMGEGGGSHATLDGCMREWDGFKGAFGCAEARDLEVGDIGIRDATTEIERLATPSSRGNAKPDGEVREVSVLMADLRGFTTFCERVPPKRMAVVLNDYLTAMVDVILGRHGLVQDFIGDGILGVFGAPDQDPDHAWHAALSALEMQAALSRLKSRWEPETGIGFTLGVAVHSGEVFAGVVGSPRRRKYAVVGDRVNTVARLEELNRVLGTSIVISGDTRALLGERVDVCARGSFAVRGRHQPVAVFELFGMRPARSTARIFHLPRRTAETTTTSLVADRFRIVAAPAGQCQSPSGRSR